MNTPNIKAESIWSMSDVRETCIKHNLYTRGDVRAYDKMLNRVEELEPDTNGLYEIAKDIQEHSEDQTISNIMFLLNRDAVRTFYQIDGEEE